MIGAIKLLPIYAFMAWRGSILYTINWLLLILVTSYVVNYYFGVFLS